MTPKTLFTIILKIFGIWLIFGILEIIPQLLASIPMFISGNVRISMSPDLIIMILIPLFYFFLIWLILFKTDFIIEKLSLDKNFEETTLDLKVDPSMVIQISIIVIGGLVLIETLPRFIEKIIFYFQQKAQDKLYDNNAIKDIISPAVKLIIGCCLIILNHQITKRIKSKVE